MKGFDMAKLQYFIVAKPNDYCPVGTIIKSHSTNNDSLLIANGQLVNENDYPELYEMINNSYAQSPLKIGGKFYLPNLN
jgi:hypothetical protein